jgi:polysaccharide biosynthesis/export protein
VTVAEQRARTFTIAGNVAAEGQYQILQNDFRMLDALVIGRGPAQSAGVEYAYVIRHPPEATPPAPAPSTEQPGGESPEPSAPSTPQTPTTDLLQPPQSKANAAGWPGQIRMLDTSGQGASSGASTDAASQPATQPSAGLLAPENLGPTTGVVEGQPVPVQSQPSAAGPATEATAPSAATTESSATTETAAGPGGLSGFKFNPPSGSEQRIIRVPIRELLAGQLQYNVVIHPGDLIYVPDPVTGEFYMGGHVQRTGPYSLTGRYITLKQAIVSAGMYDQAAIPGRSEVIRRLGTDKEVFVRIDLDKIWAGEQPDLYLKPNDIVMVGTNVIAPFVAAVRNGFRISYGFGFLYDINYAPNQNQGIP